MDTLYPRLAPYLSQTIRPARYSLVSNAKITAAYPKCIIPEFWQKFENQYICGGKNVKLVVYFFFNNSGVTEMLKLLVDSFLESSKDVYPLVPKP